jgi:hypothetical protein
VGSLPATLANLDGDDDFADLLVGLHVAIGFDDLGKREDLVNAGLEVAGCDLVEDVFFGLSQGVGFGYDLEERVAADGEGLGECREEWEDGGFGGQRTVLDDDCAVGSGGGEGFETFASYWVEDNAGTFSTGDLVDACDKIFVVGDDYVVGPEGEEFVFFGGGAGGGDTDGSLGFDKLDGSESYAAAGGGEENEVAFGEVSVVDEGSVCGDVLHPDGGAFFGREVCGVLGEGVGGDDGDFAADAVFVEREAGNSAGGFAEPGGVDVGADGFYGAGGFVA